MSKRLFSNCGENFPHFLPYRRLQVDDQVLKYNCIYEDIHVYDAGIQLVTCYNVSYIHHLHLMTYHLSLRSVIISVLTQQRYINRVICILHKLFEMLTIFQNRVDFRK